MCIQWQQISEALGTTTNPNVPNCPAHQNSTAVIRWSWQFSRGGSLTMMYPNDTVQIQELRCYCCFSLQRAPWCCLSFSLTTHSPLANPHRSPISEKSYLILDFFPTKSNTVHGRIVRRKFQGLFSCFIPLWALFTLHRMQRGKHISYFHHFFQWFHWFFLQVFGAKNANVANIDAI